MQTNLQDQPITQSQPGRHPTALGWLISSEKPAAATPDRSNGRDHSQPFPSDRWAFPNQNSSQIVIDSTGRNRSMVATSPSQ